MANASKKVMISADVLYAFVDRAHTKYPQATAYFRYFSEQKYQVYTTYSLVIEAYNLIYDKISPSLARDFVRGITLSSINILYPTESDTKAAIKTLVNYRSPELNFVQAQMAVLCNRYSIGQVCTFEYLHPLFGLTAFYLPI